MVGMTRKKTLFWLCIFLLPNLLGFLIFIAIPILGSLGISFTDWDLVSTIHFTGFENYKRLFNDPEFWKSFRNTITFIIGYLPSVMILGLACALMLNQKIKLRPFFRAVYFLPVITSWVAVSLVWKWLFNPSYGLINYFLSLVGIAGPNWLTDPQTAMIAVIITSAWKDIGFVMVLFLGGLQNISPSYYEAANMDGASKLRQLFSITIPLLTPTTFFVTIISLINSFQVFDQVMIMTEGGPSGATMTLVQNIYNHAFRYFEMGYASAMSWILFIVIFIITIIQNKLQKRWSNY
ncbi:sugar ABC transporter permease [Listeria monocytogenes]|nr:sugar ABC transporter permease [Listeria monocytogenes]EAD0713364.1 sugar ABC transporter permease [Listeria monocytogenes]EAD1241738.1 sugar ABC transporter permease [Listeria monocytogenes]EAD8889159.1 sugar ABC transporter permease [Listeria monocytogenes]EAE7095683.1 sugar ABC transporter permease [Listeria monocytogenes]